jgi:8-amino-3,8-dideoxy-alpha-D-manno-octulosonate transaminase
LRAHPYSRGRGIELLGDAERDNVNKVLESRALFRYENSLGMTDEVERKLREHFGVEHALALSSGTAALFTALVAMGVQEGDEVIVPAVTFVATIGAVVMARAVPVFAEVDDSLTLDPASVEANITPRTKVIVPVHLDNVAADMDPIMALARRHGVRVLEDAAQAIGVDYRGRKVGSIGDAAEFSFQQGKNITSGEGGAVVTSDWGIHDNASRFQDQGGQFTTTTGRRRHSSGEPFIGMNLRMTEMAGAVLTAQLDRLDGIVGGCRARTTWIRSELVDLGLDWRRMPDESGEGGSLIFFADDAERAREIGAAINAEGIPAGQMYDAEAVYLTPAVLARKTLWQTGGPFHSKEFPTGREYHPGLCPRSEDLFGRHVIIGVGPRMTDNDTELVVAAVRKVAAGLRLRG